MEDNSNESTQSKNNNPDAQPSRLNIKNRSEQDKIPVRTRQTRAPSKDKPFNFSLAATFLSILLSVIGIGQITIWLNSSSKIARYQSQVEITNLLVNQAFQGRGQTNPQLFICLQSQGIPERIVYVICDSQKLVAEDEFELIDGSQGERLKIRRFYDRSGTSIMAIDRYEYFTDNQISQINRVIFQNILFVARCAYVENIYNPTGILTQNKFTGACNTNMIEIPALSSLRIVPPPPIVLFMPYR